MVASFPALFTTRTEAKKSVICEAPLVSGCLWNVRVLVIELKDARPNRAGGSIKCVLAFPKRRTGKFPSVYANGHYHVEGNVHSPNDALVGSGCHGVPLRRYPLGSSLEQGLCLSPTWTISG